MQPPADARSRSAPTQRSASSVGVPPEAPLCDGDELTPDEPVGPEQAGGSGPGTPRPGGPGDGSLTDREREILAFERQWWKNAGAKEQAIRDTFDLSATRYYQLLNGLLDNPAALAADPMVVARLRRLRATSARQRRR